MTHLDPDLLALLALGEDAATDDERAHLRDCPGCAEELARLRRAVDAGRDVGGVLRLEEPDPRVWVRIAEELGLRRRRRRRTALLALAAAVVLLVGGIGVVLIRSGAPLASAHLSAFPAWPGRSGTAVLERGPGGSQVLDVRTTVRPDAATDHEVWLMTAGAGRLVGLGLLRGEDGRFTVPAGIDVHRFRYVDVSDEPRDGNPAHSGDSIVRGPLRF